jgi:7,8-dihydro-6-hydroxymethylpterin-pyrophosphokinase
MATDLKETDSALSKAMKNPLAEATKKSDVANAISDDKTKNLAPNQISQQLDKFENSLIRKKKFQEQ